MLQDRAGLVAKVEWYLGELYPRVGFIVVDFYDQSGTAEQPIKELFQEILPLIDGLRPAPA